MKYSFNNISREEKQRILEMHETKKSLINEQKTHNTNVTEIIADCAYKNHVEIPTACQNLRPDGGDMNQNQFATCIKQIKTVANPEFGSCVMSQLGIHNAEDVINKAKNMATDYYNKITKGVGF